MMVVFALPGERSHAHIQGHGMPSTCASSGGWLREQGEMAIPLRVCGDIGGMGGWQARQRVGQHISSTRCPVPAQAAQGTSRRVATVSSPSEGMRESPSLTTPGRSGQLLCPRPPVPP